MSDIKKERRKLKKEKGSDVPTMSELASLCVLFGKSAEEILKNYPYLKRGKDDNET